MIQTAEPSHALSNIVSGGEVLCEVFEAECGKSSYSQPVNAAFTPNGFKTACKAFSIVSVQVGVLVVEVLLVVVPVLVVPVEVPLPVVPVPVLLLLVLLGTLLPVVVVPEVVPVVLPVPVVVLPVPAVVLVVLALHPVYVAVAPKIFKMLVTRPSMVEQELVAVPVEDVAVLEVELPEEPELLHVVCALAGSEKLAHRMRASSTGATRMVFCSNFLFI